MAKEGAVKVAALVPAALRVEAGMEVAAAVVVGVGSMVKGSGGRQMSAAEPRAVAEGMAVEAAARVVEVAVGVMAAHPAA